MPSKISPFWNTWYTWKGLRLPWRTKFLAGRDLEGNTYWEFRDLRYGGADNASNTARMRRIVKYPRGTHPGSVMVSPMWHQWLRHVRHDPPSVVEQQQEVARQQRMRILAARADARWEGAQRVEGPLQVGELAQQAQAEGQPLAPPQKPAQPVAVQAQTPPPPPPPPQRQSDSLYATPVPEPAKHDPWAKAQAPTEEWQPEAWSPTPKR